MKKSKSTMQLQIDNARAAMFRLRAHSIMLVASRRGRKARQLRKDICEYAYGGDEDER